MGEVVELGNECHPAAMGSCVAWRERSATDHPAAWLAPAYDAQAASAMKQQGNTAYSARNYGEAIRCYNEAIALTDPADEALAYSLAVYHSNRAACHLQLEAWHEAVEDATAALGYDPRYVKALMRRAAAHEALERLEDALADYKAVLAIDPRMAQALAKATALEATITERQEKMKEEMLGKLKGFGNTILGKFGLSTDNFKMVQDPATGGYNISFQQ